jgi:hypothetical protein
MAMASRAVVIKRLGAAGFLFFFAKGMVWLAIAAAAVMGIYGD